MNRRALFLLALFLAATLPSGRAATDNGAIAAWKEREESWRALRNQRFAELQGREDIHGLEVLLAGQTFERVESSFGHVALRFLGSGDPLDDVVVGYGANVTDRILDREKAVEGAYAMDLTIYPLRDFLQDYLIQQKRSVTRFVIPASREQLLRLRDIAVDDYLHPSEHYTFFGNAGQRLFGYRGLNCSEALQSALRRAGFPLPDNALVPLEIGALLLSSGLAPLPPVSLFDPGALLEKMFPFLNGRPLSGLRGIDFLDYFRWVQLASPQIKAKKLMLEIYRNKPPGDPHALKDEEIFGLVPLLDSYYARNGSGEPAAWREDPAFARSRKQFCFALGGAVMHPSFQGPAGAREGLLANYRANCL